MKVHNYMKIFSSILSTIFILISFVGCNKHINSSELSSLNNGKYDSEDYYVYNPEMATEKNSMTSSIQSDGLNDAENSIKPAREDNSKVSNRSTITDEKTGISDAAKFILRDDIVPVSKTKKLIAISVDDGPNECIKDFNDVAIKNNARLTYFLVGNKVLSSASGELLRCLSYGFELGNHSWDYDVLTLPSISIAEAENKIKKTNNVIEDMTGYKVKIFRFPNISYNKNLINLTRSLDMPMLTGRAVDLGIDITTEEIEDNIISVAEEGIIILCHMRNQTAEALKIALPKLEKQGFQVVTITEMFTAYGYQSIPLGQENLGSESIKK